MRLVDTGDMIGPFVGGIEPERTRFFLFALKGVTKPDGWPRRLAYGVTPADALEILSYRLTPKEMRQIVRDDFVQLHHQREIPALVREGKLA